MIRMIPQDNKRMIERHPRFILAQRHIGYKCPGARVARQKVKRLTERFLARRETPSGEECYPVLKGGLAVYIIILQRRILRRGSCTGPHRKAPRVIAETAVVLGV
jgi:hypothetical protein